MPPRISLNQRVLPGLSRRVIPLLHVLAFFLPCPAASFPALTGNPLPSKMKPVSKRMPHNIVGGILILTDPLQRPPVSDYPRQSGLQAGVLLTENHLLPAVAR